MFQDEKRNTEEQNENVKNKIKSAWEGGDFWRLVRTGFDSFINVFGKSTPVPFQKFLEYTSASFDRYILDVIQQEHLNYVGGKMVLEVDKPITSNPIPVRLSADFYFQTVDKKWIVKKRTGQIDSSRFIDWETDTDAGKLRESGKLEMSIDPPQSGEKA